MAQICSGYNNLAHRPLQPVLQTTSTTASEERPKMTAFSCPDVSLSLHYIPNNAADAKEGTQYNQTRMHTDKKTPSFMKKHSV